MGALIASNFSWLWAGCVTLLWAEFYTVPRVQSLCTYSALAHCCCCSVVKRTFSQRSAMSSTSLHEDKMNISLLCPLSMSRRRITLPARGIECTHIQVCTAVNSTTHAANDNNNATAAAASGGFRKVPGCPPPGWLDTFSQWSEKFAQKCFFCIKVEKFSGEGWRAVPLLGIGTSALSWTFPTPTPYSRILDQPLAAAAAVTLHFEIAHFSRCTPDYWVFQMKKVKRFYICNWSAAYPSF